jgi:hypothetical protein
MNDTRNIAIVLLLVSAAVLTAVVVALQNTAEPALAAAASSRGGEYIMATGGWSDTRDLLYIVDIAAEKLNVYSVDLNENAVQREDSVDLAELFRGG